LNNYYPASEKTAGWTAKRWTTNGTILEITVTEMITEIRQYSGRQTGRILID